MTFESSTLVARAREGMDRLVGWVRHEKPSSGVYLLEQSARLEQQNAETLARREAVPYPAYNAHVTSATLLINPTSGAGLAASAADVTARILRGYGINTVRRESRSLSHAVDIARETAVQNDPGHILFVIGGDGLVNAAWNGVAHTSQAIGIIPAGTGNDHANALGIPLDPRAAAEVIARGRVTSIDLAEVRGHSDGTSEHRRIFGTAACAGLDSIVCETANRLPWPTGRWRYTAAAILELFRAKALPARIVADGVVLNKGPVLLSAVGNLSHYGGGMRVCPQADYRDGLLDITVIDKMHRTFAIRKFISMFRGDVLRQRGAYSARAEKISLDFPAIRTFVDGEAAFPFPVTIKVLPAAGRVIVPAP